MRTLRTFAIAFFVTLGLASLLAPPPLGPAVAHADRTTATTVWHSGLQSLTGASTTIQTDTMLRRVCVGWYLENLDGSDTIYLNVNNYKNPEPAASAGSYDDQVVIPPGVAKEIHVHNIKQIQGVADGDGADLYWAAICHLS